MTPKKRKFALFLAEGMSPEVAAISAGYSAATAARRAKEMADDEAVKALIRREREKPTPREFTEPEEYMRWLMNNEDESTSMRWKAANSLMAHNKAPVPGKKAQQLENAKKVSGKFAAMTAPPLKH